MQHNLQNEFLKIKVNLFGAELCSVIDTKTNFEYIWQAGNEWKRHAPILFPIVGKLINNQYEFKDKLYNLPQHGFARDLNFTLISSNTNQLIFELNSNENTKSNYPFEFKLQIVYTLENNRLKINYTVINQSNSDVYFSIGAHPAFNTTYKGCNLNEYSLLIDKTKLISTKLYNGLIEKKHEDIEIKNNFLKLNTSLFDNDAIVIENNQINKIELLNNAKTHSIKMYCENWPYFGIWTKPNNTKFICIEPWYGITDTSSHNQQFINKKGIIKLNPYSAFECGYSIAFFTE
jgi:galactose mutarotase-like enzyme